MQNAHLYLLKLLSYTFNGDDKDNDDIDDIDEVEDDDVDDNGKLFRSNERKKCTELSEMARSFLIKNVGGFLKILMIFIHFWENCSLKMQ